MYWRGLGARSTSKDEDFIPILANLLGLSAAELLNIEDSSWRMLAIMKSLGQLPSSLLFDVGSRISGGDIAQHFRWLPARPGMQDVSRHSAMTINDAGIFLPDPDDKDSANPLTIFEVEGLAAKIAEGDSFLLRLRSFPISDLYKVKIHHNLSSGLSFNEDDKWAVLIETLTESKSLTLRGALFHVEHMETRKAIDISRALFYTSPRLRELDEASWGKLEATEYTGVYCSPLTFTKLLPSVTHTTDSQLECEEVPIWKVHLKCGKAFHHVQAPKLSDKSQILWQTFLQFLAVPDSPPSIYLLSSLSSLMSFSRCSPYPLLSSCSRSTWPPTPFRS